MAEPQAAMNDFLHGGQVSDMTEEINILKKRMRELEVSTNILGGGGDGWVAAGAWTYASATTITVASGAALIYGVGDKLRWKQGAGYKYAYIVTVADTLLTVTGGSDYTVATPTAITDNYYSKASTPLGFPQWFNYTPTGIAATNVTHAGRFCINGRRCSVDYHAVFSNTITYTTNPTLPVAVSANMCIDASIAAGCVGMAGYYDSAVAYFPTGMAICLDVSAVVMKLVTSTGALMSATAPITWNTGDILDAHFSYEI